MAKVHKFQGPTEYNDGIGRLSLTKQQGDLIRDLIAERYNFGLESYANLVGIQVSNIYAVLNGNRATTASYINRILSGINMELKCLLSINIQEFNIQESETGADVEDAHCQLLDEEWWSEETQEEGEA